MSYDVSLEIGGELVQVESHTDGGTYVMGGSTDASLNITYNYAECYRLTDLKSIRELDGRRASDVVGRLRSSVEFLGTTTYERDYWAPTPGNAGHAIAILLKWAEANPDAVFRVI